MPQLTPLRSTIPLALLLALAAAGALIIVIVVGQPGTAPGGAGVVPPDAPAGRGLARPEQVARSFADAVTRRDYATARALVNQGSSWAGDYLLERTEEQHRLRVLDHYVITRLDQTGSSTTALIHWSPVPGATIGGVAARDVCLTVQVGSDGQLQPIDDYHWCRNGE